MNAHSISVVEVARELGKSKQTIFKILKRLRIETVKEKSSDHRGQRIAYITADDLNRLREYCTGFQDKSAGPIEQEDLGGVSYLVQLEPSHDPGRFKLGFATNIEERLRSHRTTAPYSEVLKKWPCKLLWEKTAIECVSQGCEQLHTEVFRADSIDEVLSRCDRFFELMPPI